MHFEYAFRLFDFKRNYPTGTGPDPSVLGAEVSGVLGSNDGAEVSGLEGIGAVVSG